jgi:tRNA (cytidine/uridine-2'-O-)-methyltransferase
MSRKYRQTQAISSAYVRTQVPACTSSSHSGLSWTRSVCDAFALSTKNSTRYDHAEFREHDALLFGPETRGLPMHVLEALPAERRLRLPMQEGNRSLNLSNSAAIVLYEAWRQLGFHGGS